VFVFLAGTSLALSLHRRLAEGESPRGLDGFHLRRVLLFALLDPLWMSWILLAWGRWLLQVMFGSRLLGRAHRLALGWDGPLELAERLLQVTVGWVASNNSVLVRSMSLRHGESPP
jgi:hypothetical protein